MRARARRAMRRVAEIGHPCSARVLPWRDGLKVLRPDTRCDAAQVVDVESLRYRPLCIGVRPSVRYRGVTPCNGESSVTSNVFCGNPKPASVGLVHFRPESLWHRMAWCGVCGSSRSYALCMHHAHAVRVARPPAIMHRAFGYSNGSEPLGVMQGAHPPGSGDRAAPAVQSRRCPARLADDKIAVSALSHIVSAAEPVSNNPLHAILNSAIIDRSRHDCASSYMKSTSVRRFTQWQ